MARPIRLAIAAAALLLAGGVAYAAQDTESAARSRYVQMNSPGDGISSGAARSGNGRARRPMRRHHRRHHHR